MTKKDLDKFMAVFAEFVEQEVNEKPAFVTREQRIENCGGYQLRLEPQCLMWDREVVFICSLAEMMCLSVEFHFNPGYIIVR